MGEVYPLPNISPLNAIPRTELTAEELDMSDDGKIAAARLLLLGSVYGANNSSVSQNVNACVGIVKGDSAQRAAAGRDALTNLPNR